MSLLFNRDSSLTLLSLPVLRAMITPNLSTYNQHVQHVSLIGPLANIGFRFRVSGSTVLRLALLLTFYSTLRNL
jgi:hypothetical protein